MEPSYGMVTVRDRVLSGKAPGIVIVQLEGETYMKVEPVEIANVYR